MASVHVYVRAQVVGNAATVKKINALAESLNEAIAAAGGVAGTASVVDDAPAEAVVVTPAMAPAKTEGKHGHK
jgi:hypothetical protein